MNRNTRGVNENEDVFKENNRTKTQQTLTPTTEGGINI